MTPIVIWWLLSGVSVNQSTRASSILEIQEELITLAVLTLSKFALSMCHTIVILV